MATGLDHFRDAYSDAFRGYVNAAGEAGLERAYDLGRTAVNDGLSMLEMAAIHHAALLEALEEAGPEGAEQVAAAATDFFIESLSTFEMTQRGFREAQRAAKLEQEHAARLQALADAALAISSALSPEEILAVLATNARNIVGAASAEARLVLGGDWARSTAVSSPGEGPGEQARELYELVAEHNRPVRLAADGHPGGQLAAPLIGRTGENLGLVHLAGKSTGEFDDSDLAMLVQLSQTASAAIERMRLYEHEHEIAETLQRSLLPPHLPDIPGVEAAARFRPAGEGNQMGGDFYDVFQTADDAWLVIIGDVCGKGAEAAAVTALARYTLRATALHESRPSRLLELLNEALLRHGPEQRFATVTCCRLDPDTGRVELASGGHPPPLIIRAGGSVEPFGSSGTLLGVVTNPDLADDSAELGQGDKLVFYTDGVTDAHAPERIVGPSELAASLAPHWQLDPASLAELVEEIALGRSDAPPRDDIAILVLARGNGRAARAVTQRDEATEILVRLQAGPDAAFEARRTLDSLGESLGEPLFGALRLVVTELVTNSVKYGIVDPGDLIGLRVVVSADRVRVEVSDPGASFEPPPPGPRPGGTSGWGLAIVDRLVDRWGIELDVDGKTVWLEVDRAA
ncbi:MAG: SpoIIE family protein phosphatase [Thermoleophilaceae bacterium]